MKITNKLGLPEPVVRAIENDPYSSGGADISVTSLVNAPRVITLMRRYGDRLVEDAADRIWSLLGQSIHEILHRANIHGIAEKRLYMEIDGWTVSGQFDRIEYIADQGMLQDFKVTSVWNVRAGGREEWVPQLNCFSDDTEVLTDSGWKLFNDLTEEDQIMSLDPETGEGYYQRPIAYQKYKYVGDLLHFESRFFDLLVTPDHNVYWQPFQKAEDKICTFDECVKRRIRNSLCSMHSKRLERYGDPSIYKWQKTSVPNIFVPKQAASYRLSSAEGVTSPRFRMKKHFAWKGVAADEFIFDGQRSGTFRKYLSSKSVNIKDYVEFMGWYLSEGFVGRKREGGGYVVGICQDANVHPENCAAIAAVLDRMGLRYRQSKSGFTFNDVRIWTYLHQFGKSYEKYIPSIIKQMPPDLLRVFLDIYCLGDGSKNGKGGWQIITTSKRMADDLQEIIHKEGQCSSISHIPSDNPNRHDRYIVSRTKAKNYDFLGGYKKVPYNGYVYDVTLPKDHILLVRRKGKTVWSGNCYALLCAKNGYPIHHLEIVAILRDWRPSELATTDRYPEHQVAMLPISLWPLEQTEAYVRERIRVHKAARETLPYCTDEDRWAQDEKWALMKKGRQKAIKLYPFRQMAAMAAAEDPSSLYVEHRPGRYVRCQSYCAVAPYCLRPHTYEQLSQAEMETRDQELSSDAV